MDKQIANLIEETRSKYGFLTFLILRENELRCGIVQNETPKMIMFYDMTKLKDDSQKKRFLRYGDEWWWQRNQSVPIDRYIGYRFDEFQWILRGYPKKSLQSALIGPTLKLSDLYLKRIKKKRIDIVNRSVKL